MLLLLALVGLLAFGMASTPAAPGLVRSIQGAVPEEQVLFLTPDGDDAAYVELVRLDDQLRPLASEYLQRDAGAAARVDGKLFLFSAGGATSITENRKVPSLDPAFVIDRFLEGDLTERIEDAAADGNQALIAGLEPDGTLALTLFDGIAFRELEQPELGEPARGEEVAVALANLDRFHVVLRTGAELRTGMVNGQRLSWQEPIPLRSGGRGLILREERDRTDAWLLDRTEDGGTDLVRVTLNQDGSPELPVGRRKLTVGADARLVGVAETDIRGPLEESLVALVAEGDSLRVVSALKAEEPGNRPMFLVAWAANWSRFEKPLGLQLALFVLLGLFSRRMRGSRQDRSFAADEPAAPAVMLQPASLLRRLLAFGLDLLLLFVLVTISYFMVLSPDEFEYFMFSYFSSMEQAQLAGDNMIIFSAPLEAMLIDARLLFMLLVTGALAFCDAAFGRTPGKALLGLRVVTANGGAPSVGAATTRALMWLLDFLWSFGLVGMALVTFTKRRQRLGDLMAGTMVVRRDAEAQVQEVEPAE